MTLLFDLGNTRLKGARHAAGIALDVTAFAHGDADFERRLDTWLDEIGESLQRPDLAWLAAVAPDAVIERVQAVLRRHRIECRRVLTQAHTPALRIAYAEPARLGVDRWLAMLAARRRGDDAVLVASVGSALTIDAVDADGQHLGGLIAPPPEAMRAALLARAPRLDVPTGSVHRFGTSTADAIASGCLLAPAALIERSLAELARRAGSDPRLLLAGGGAEPLRAWLPPHDFAPHLVLEGLATWADSAAR